MHINDSGLSSMGMSTHHHMENHFDNVLNLNMNSADYHYGSTVEYWNSSYKNGSTPMKEMEGESHANTPRTPLVSRIC